MLLFGVEVGGVHVVASPGDWPVFHADLQHTGTTSETVTPPLTVKWRYTTGSYVYSSPAVSGGVVYVGSDDNRVYVFGTPAPVGGMLMAISKFTILAPYPALGGLVGTLALVFATKRRRESQTRAVGPVSV